MSKDPTSITDDEKDFVVNRIREALNGPTREGVQHGRAAFLKELDDTTKAYLEKVDEFDVDVGKMTATIKMYFDTNLETWRFEKVNTAMDIKLPSDIKIVRFDFSFDSSEED